MTILEGLIKTASDNVVLFLHDECVTSIDDIKFQIKELNKECSNWERRADVTSKEIKKRSIGFAAPIEPTIEETPYEESKEPVVGPKYTEHSTPAPGWVPERTTRQVAGGEYDIS